jgi:hypothetical protein
MQVPWFCLVGMSLLGCSEQAVGKYNTPPSVAITHPVDGQEFDEDEMIELMGVVQDDQSSLELMQARWVSDEEGVLGEVFPDEAGNVYWAVSELEIGGHAITLQVIDTDGEQSQSSVFIDIDQIQYREPEEEEDPPIEDPNDGAPSVSIVSPQYNDVFSSANSILMEGMVLDSETDLDDLLVRWDSDRDGMLFSSTADSEGFSALTTNLSVGGHVVTLTVRDGAGQEASDTVLIDVQAPTDHDGDDDGWSEADGDCDDDDLSVSPSATEQCDLIDNDCDGEVNEDWRDEAEPNDVEAVEMGSLDGTLWFGSSAEIEGLTLHNEDDLDFYSWDAGDDLWDDAAITVEVTGLPSDGDHWLGLYLWQDDDWVLQDSDSGASELTVSKDGSWFDWDEDLWLVAVMPESWSDSSCTSEYTLRISS